MSNSRQTDKQIEQIKIAKILPLAGPTYKVDLGASADKNSYSLIITYYSETGKQDAIDAIKILGYDPNIYELTYIDGLK